MSKLFLPLLLSLAAATAQSPLTTTFVNNNGGNVGGAVYFDLNVTNPAGITITSLDLNFGSAAGTVGSVDIFVIPGGTYVGNQANSAPWILIGTAPNVVSAGPGLPTTCTLAAPIALPGAPGGSPGACACRANNLAHAYTNGLTNPTVFSNADLTLSAGSASNVPFTAPTFDPRVVNTNINYLIGANGTLATNASTGAGCYARFASAYEAFAAGTNDLSNTCFTWTPNTAGGYTVTQSGPGIQPISPAAQQLALTDDSSIAVGTLGLEVGSNGWVAFGPGNSTGFTPDIPTMLNNPSTAVYTWHDMNPAAAGSGQVFYEEPTPTSAIVTYNGVYNFGGTTAADANFIQIRINCPNGPLSPWTIEVDMGQLSALGNNWLHGFSPGGPSNDPGNRDLSATTPFSTAAADANPLRLTASSRPITGTSWNLAVSNSALLDLVIIGLADPNIPDLFFVGLPGCGLRATLDVISVGSTFALAVPANPTLVGFQIFANAASLSPGVNAFGAITSNGIAGVVGDL